MKYLISMSLISCFLIAGCATTPINTELAEKINDEKIVSEKYLEQEPNTNIVIIKRDEGFIGSLCDSKVYIDGKIIAEVGPGEKINLYLPFGTHIVSAKSAPCGGGLAEMEITVKNDKENILRIGYGTNGEYFIRPTAF